MQQWLKDGEYVFLAKQRTSGYTVDAFSAFGKLEVRTHTLWSGLGDPRDIGFDGVYYASVQDKYKYALRDFREKIPCDEIFRSVNANTYNETLMRRDVDMWRMCKYHEAVFDRERMSAVKIAVRHGKASYIYDSLWWDMLDSITYLKKDVRNPSIVCPENLREAHDKWLKSADNKKKKMEDRMTKLRLIAEEKMQLRYLEQAAKAEEENKKKAEAISIKLEELYGAELNCGVDKLGDDHIFKFYIESLNDKYAYKQENILLQSIDLLFDIVFNPLVENGQFNEEYFESEKGNLKQKIEAKKDNKSAYAYTRCIETMYKDQPYGLYSYGYAEDLDKITNKELYETYLNIIKNCKIDIFASGDFTEEIDSIIEKNTEKLSAREVEQFYIETEEKTGIIEKVVKEKMDVSQGKLVIGLDVLENDKNATSVYNAILGGGANSKLFQNVREKASLAYSAGSMYIKQKRNIIIRSGIEIENYDKALEIIEKQIEDMKQEEFSDKDIQNAKELIIASIKSMQDEQDSEISYCFGRELMRENIDAEEDIRNIEQVTKEQIVKIAKSVQINTIYFLTTQ